MSSAKKSTKPTQLVLSAIDVLKGTRGSSLKEITSFIAADCDLTKEQAGRRVVLALKKGMEYGVIARNKQGLYQLKTLSTESGKRRRRSDSCTEAATRPKNVRRSQKVSKKVGRRRRSSSRTAVTRRRKVSKRGGRRRRSSSRTASTRRRKVSKRGGRRRRSASRTTVTRRRKVSKRGGRRRRSSSRTASTRRRKVSKRGGRRRRSSSRTASTRRRRVSKSGGRRR